MVVPTYNERERIAELVQRLFDASKAAAIELEVIVVDDNSPDGTGQLADELAKSHRMTVVHRPGKLGLGAAVIEGFRVASAPFMGVMDADFSHPPSAVLGLVATIRATGANLVVGSRYVPGGSISNWPWRRRFMSRLACLLARPLSPIRDATSGFFVIRADLARRATIKASGFKINLELNIRAWPSAPRRGPVPLRRSRGWREQDVHEGRPSLPRPAPRPVHLQVDWRAAPAAGVPANLAGGARRVHAQEVAQADDAPPLPSVARQVRTVASRRPARPIDLPGVLSSPRRAGLEVLRVGY